MQRCSDVGILTVSRYLKEGVEADVRCFVAGKGGLHEVHGFERTATTIQARVKPSQPTGFLRLRVGITWIPVNLDTEVFLARRNLTGWTRAEVLEVAERAASIDALTMPVQHPFAPWTCRYSVCTPSSQHAQQPENEVAKLWCG